MATPLNIALASIPVVLAAVGGIVRVARLEGRVDTVEKVAEVKDADLKELINTRFNALDPRLERIEKALNGYIKHYND